MSENKSSFSPLMIAAAGATLILSAGIWFACYLAPTPLIESHDSFSRVMFAFNCICIACVFVLLLGIEAVAHDRLFTPAINPLAGFETQGLRVNLRFLQNSLEQIILFSFGLIAFSYWCEEPRFVLAATLTWIVTRFIYWVGYRKNPLWRLPGLIGMVQSIVILAFVLGKFLISTFGVGSAIFALLVFLGAEGILFRNSYREAKLIKEKGR